MLNCLKIVEAVATEISKKHSDFDVINDKLEQGFKKVIVLESLFDIKRIMVNRYQYELILYISIFSEDVNEITMVGSDLFTTLQFVKLEDRTILGYDYSFQIFKRVGQAKVSYKVWEYIPKQEITMNKYQYDGGINGK